MLKWSIKFIIDNFISILNSTEVTLYRKDRMSEPFHFGFWKPLIKLNSLIAKNDHTSSEKNQTLINWPEKDHYRIFLNSIISKVFE